MIFKVEEMSCNHCVKSIEDAFSKVEGVEEISVNLAKKEVEIKSDLAIDVLVSEFESIGFDAELVK